jgi:hypothetical protein
VKLTAQEEEGLTLQSTSFFLSRSSINLRINLSLLLAYLSKIELLIDCMSSRESCGLDRTLGVTSALWMMIGDASLRSHRNVLSHKLDMLRKPQFEIGEIRVSGFKN